MALPDVMKLLAEELNGKYQKFVQGEGRAQFPEDLPGGYCQGLSIAWLVLLRTGTSLRAELKRDPPAWQHYVASIQRTAMNVGYGAFSPTAPSIADHLEKTLAAKSFFKDGTKLPAFPFNTMADYIWNNGSGGYYFVLVPGHAMAAYADQSVLRFFDPNAGEVQFDKHALFELFICRYFCHQEVSAAYSYPLREEQQDRTKPKRYPMLDVNLRGNDDMIEDKNRRMAIYRLRHHA